jgi:hypothetical protein
MGNQTGYFLIESVENKISVCHIGAGVLKKYGCYAVALRMPLFNPVVLLPKKEGNGNWGADTSLLIHEIMHAYFMVEEIKCGRSIEEEMCWMYQHIIEEAIKKHISKEAWKKKIKYYQNTKFYYGGIFTLKEKEKFVEMLKNKGVDIYEYPWKGKENHENRKIYRQSP